jgi:predicted proteasome-type protease
VTICVSVKVRDGLVLGTDSMAQISAADADGREV